MQLADKTEQEFTSNKQMAGTITIGMGESYASDFAAEWMNCFHQEHAQVQFGLYTGNADQIQEKVDAGTIDIGIMLDPFSCDEYEYFRIPIQERIGVVMKADHPLCSRKEISADDLGGAELLLTARRQADSQQWLKANKAHPVFAGYHDLPGNGLRYLEKTNALVISCEGACVL